MQQYYFQACDLEGSIQDGQIGAESEQEVIGILQTRQLIPLKIEEIEESSTSLFALGLLEGITEKSVVKELIAELRRDVKEGKSLAEALQAHPQTFSRMYVNMVRAGEEGGILEQLLPKLADFLSSADEAKRTVISSMIYPAILLFTGVLSVVLLMVFVVPQFASLFEGMGSNIPDSAKLLLTISHGLQNYWWVLLIIPVLIWLGWKQLDRTSESRLQRDKFLLAIPILGALLLQAESSRFCRTLGSLISAGIPLLKGLHITQGVMENQVLANSVAEAEEAVRGGTGLGKALTNTQHFPTLLSQLVVVGEESGRTGEILEKLAETFDDYVKQQTSRLVALAEPLLILLLGVIVGAVVITMLSAVFSITSVNL